MPAVLNSTDAFAIPSRMAFVISGDIVSGVAKAGMTMKIRMNSAMVIDLPISSIEFVTKKDRSEVGLLTICRRPEKAARKGGQKRGQCYILEFMGHKGLGPEHAKEAAYG